jgi:hypothetical protein
MLHRVRDAYPANRNAGAGLNAPLTIPPRQSPSRPAATGRAKNPPSWGCDMDFEALDAKTPATLDEIRTRVAYALERHPLCRSVQFDIVSMPRTAKGNWTISLRSVTPDALWEASDIVADIQDAYDLAVAA